MTKTKIAANLTGIPETLLWTLWNRSEEARRSDAILRDPEAVRIADSIDYPYQRKFGPPSRDTVMRAVRYDEQIRLYLRAHPETTVVALGEGLETQFHRVDNGSLRWLAVDLPETIALRRHFLPDSDRHRNLALSALDPAWMKDLDPAKGIVVTAQGLLMYFDEHQVRELIGRCAGNFPGGWMLLDVISRNMSRRTLEGRRKTADFRPPAMPWGLDADELQSLRSFHPAITKVVELRSDLDTGLVSATKRAIKRVIGRVDRDRLSMVRLVFADRS